MLGTGGDGQRRPRQGSTHSLGREGGRRKCRPSATPSVRSWGHCITAGNGGQMEEQIREEARALISSGQTQVAREELQACPTEPVRVRRGEGRLKLWRFITFSGSAGK